MAKKAYKKPEVKKVHLKPEEAVLTACKGPGTGGPDFANCRHGIATYCFDWRKT